MNTRRMSKDDLAVKAQESKRETKEERQARRKAEIQAANAKRHAEFEAEAQLPPHAVAGTPPAATFWELWTDKRGVDAVNATQHQLLQMDASVCCNAAECGNFLLQSFLFLTRCAGS